MLLLLYGHTGTRLCNDTNMASPYKAANARIENHTDLNLGEVVYISIINPRLLSSFIELLIMSLIFGVTVQTNNSLDL